MYAGSEDRPPRVLFLRPSVRVHFAIPESDLIRTPPGAPGSAGGTLVGLSHDDTRSLLRFERAQHLGATFNAHRREPLASLYVLASAAAQQLHRVYAWCRQQPSRTPRRCRRGDRVAPGLGEEPVDHRGSSELAEAPSRFRAASNRGSARYNIPHPACCDWLDDPVLADDLPRMGGESRPCAGARSAAHLADRLAHRIEPCFSVADLLAAGRRCQVFHGCSSGPSAWRIAFCFSAAASRSSRAIEHLRYSCMPPIRSRERPRSPSLSGLTISGSASALALAVLFLEHAAPRLGHVRVRTSHLPPRTRRARSCVHIYEVSEQRLADLV